MANLATRTLLEEQDEMVSIIQEEIIEHTGKPYGFAFTENIFLVNGRVWHEFKMLDGTELLMYAFNRGTPEGGIIVVNEKEDMHRWE